MEVAVERRVPGGNAAAKLLHPLLNLPAQTLHLILIGSFAVLLDNCIESRVGSDSPVVRVRFDFAGAIRLLVVSVVRAVILPKVRKRRSGPPPCENHLMLLLVAFLEELGEIERLDLDLKSSLQRFLLQDQRKLVVERLIAHTQREGQTFALCIHEHSITTALGVSGLLEVFLGLGQIKRFRPQLRTRVATEAREGALHAHSVATQDHFDHLLEIQRVVDARPDVLVVEARLALVQVNATRDARIDVVELVALDVAVQQLRDLALVIPINRRQGDVSGGGEEVDLALPKQLIRGVGGVDRAVFHPVRIEAVTVVFLVFRPPVLHPGQRDAAAELDVLRLDVVGPCRRHLAPLIARRKVIRELAEEMPGQRRHVGLEDRVRRQVPEGDGHGVIVVFRDRRIVLVELVNEERVFGIRRQPNVEKHEEVLDRDFHTVRISGGRIKAEEHGLAIVAHRPSFGETGDPLVHIQLLGHQSHLDVIPMLAPERVGTVRAKETQCRREIRRFQMKHAALLRSRIAHVRVIGAGLPFQIRRNVCWGLELIQLRLRLPSRLDLRRVVIRREAVVSEQGAWRKEHGASKRQGSTPNKTLPARCPILFACSH